jgi:hypothetical protein
MDLSQSRYFTKEEFEEFTPHPFLLQLLEAVRKELNSPVILTSLGRTFEEHINIYKEIYGDNWSTKLVANSRHLPSWETSFLRAVDFKVVKKDKSLFTGEEIKKAIFTVSEKLSWINIGIGVGDYWSHVDIDRTKRKTIWYY